jgi:hypothetical protein
MGVCEWRGGGEEGTYSLLWLLILVVIGHTEDCALCCKMGEK